ncbi:MAG: permease-like cell division protein FtsX [Nocardioides sp.]|uniref:permease-like cell division protein FtsX n=1 Tax=Nocardioides sp. TaxID=35761 RepID=UPI0039E6783B
MTLRYVFSELGQGLRRNLSMHVAVVLTLFVSLTLVGLGVLLSAQATKATDFWGSQLEIMVWLCKDKDTSPSCSSAVTDAQRDAIIKVIEENPEVDTYHVESQQVAYEKAKELYEPKLFEGSHPVLTPESLRESIWIQLKDPKEYQGIESAVQGLDGVSSIADMRDYLKPILATISRFRLGAIGAAATLVIAAVLLVGNTIRLAALARRREIGIMRLVGASTLYIILPFLLEALVTALLSVAMAIGALAAFMQFYVFERLSDDLKFIPWIRWPEFGSAVVVIAILGPLLTLLPTLVLTRKYTKV